VRPTTPRGQDQCGRPPGGTATAAPCRPIEPWQERLDIWSVGAGGVLAGANSAPRRCARAAGRGSGPTPAGGRAAAAGMRATSTPTGCAVCACRRSAPTTWTGSCSPHPAGARPSWCCCCRGCRCRALSRWTSEATGHTSGPGRPDGSSRSAPPPPSPQTTRGSAHQPRGDSRPYCGGRASSPTPTHSGSAAGSCATGPESRPWPSPTPPSAITVPRGGAGSAGCCGWRWLSATPTVTTSFVRRPSTTCPTSPTPQGRSCGARASSAPATTPVSPALPPRSAAASTAARGACGRSARAAASGPVRTRPAPVVAVAERGCRSAMGCAAAAACMSASTARRR
jgi:hypothetical protein